MRVLRNILNAVDQVYRSQYLHGVIDPELDVVSGTARRDVHRVIEVYFQRELVKRKVLYLPSKLEVRSSFKR